MLEALGFTAYNSQFSSAMHGKSHTKPSEHILYQKNLKEGGCSASELGFFQNASPKLVNPIRDCVRY